MAWDCCTFEDLIYLWIFCEPFKVPGTTVNTVTEKLSLKITLNSLQVRRKTHNSHTLNSKQLSLIYLFPSFSFLLQTLFITSVNQTFLKIFSHVNFFIKQMWNFKNTFHFFSSPLQNLNLISHWRYSHLHVTDWKSQKKHLWFALLHFTLATEGWYRFLFVHSPAGRTTTEPPQPLLSDCQISWTVHWWRKQGRRRGWCAGCWSWVWWPPHQPSLQRLPGHGPSSEAWRNWSLPFWRLKQKTTVIVLADYPQFHTHLKNVCVKLRVTWPNSLLTVETENHSHRFDQVSISHTS